MPDINSPTNSLQQGNCHYGLTAMTKKRLARPITEKRLTDSLQRMAQIIANGHHQYLPIFLRLEAELVTFKKQMSAIERAKILCGKVPPKN